MDGVLKTGLVWMLEYAESSSGLCCGLEAMLEDGLEGWLGWSCVGHYAVIWAGV
jgi:hypothetical protein